MLKIFSTIAKQLGNNIIHDYFYFFPVMWLIGGSSDNVLIKYNKQVNSDHFWLNRHFQGVSQQKILPKRGAMME